MNPANHYGIVRPGDECRIVCENDEEPMIFGSEEAGFQFEPWITVTTKHAVREANIELEILTKKQQKEKYRTLSLHIITKGKRYKTLYNDVRQLNVFHETFIKWAILRMLLFGKDLPISKNMVVKEILEA